MSRIVLFAFCLLLGAGFTLSVMPARAQPRGEVCPERIGTATSLVCACPDQAGASGAIWGSDLYTDDSNICRAAVHAGAIPLRGGTIRVFERPGRDDYPAVDRNGIASGHWPAWRRSIAFGDPAKAPLEEASAFAACPTNAAGLAIGARLHCSCSILAAGDGAIWGTDRYTADSAICHAARHAGAIGEGGGEVSLHVIAGAGDYPASNRNGVSSSHWGSYGRSYVFDR